MESSHSVLLDGSFRNKGVTGQRYIPIFALKNYAASFMLVFRDFTCIWMFCSEVEKMKMSSIWLPGVRK